MGADRFSRCKVKFQGQEYILAYSFRQTATGERAIVHIIHQSLTDLSLDGLGLSTQAVEQLKQALESPGIIVATGPRGSGKSTILQIITHYTTTLDKNIFTVEDVVGLKIKGVRQLQAKPQGPSKAQILQAIQANQADIIVIDEINKETLPAILKAVDNGCLILLVITASDISKAI
ncbi:MAG: ATPase, T2SS/T4P/T4SS family [Mariprofundaceae bacterium]